MKKNNIFKNPNNGSEYVSGNFKGNFSFKSLNWLKLLNSLLTNFFYVICSKDV